MNNPAKRLGLIAALCLVSGRAGAAQAGAETPEYSNVRVISVDPARRILVVLNTKGHNETLMFDDLLVNTGAVKAGDRVIVTVRGGPGQKRVTAIVPTSPTATAPRANPLPITRSLTAADRREMRERLARQVAVISEEARVVDAAWASFVTTCRVRLTETTGGGRDWFGLWDGRVQADYSSGTCRDMFNQLVSSGEGIKKAMAAAESATEDTLDPGEIRNIRRLYNMNWDGWKLKPPAKRDP